jgi:hypothetical protein
MTLAFSASMRIPELICRLLFLLTLGLLTESSLASDWGIVLNGKSFHVDAEHDWNENNWGLGFELEFQPEARWVKVAVGGGFVDSQDSMSYMAGAGLKRRFRVPRVGREFYVDVGAIGFLMTRQDVDNNRPFPGILPTLTVGSRHVAVNLAYLPGSAAHEVAGVRNLDPSIDAIYFMQIRLSPRLFAPVNSRLRMAFADRGN